MWFGVAVLSFLSNVFCWLLSTTTGLLYTLDQSEERKEAPFGVAVALRYKQTHNECGAIMAGIATDDCPTYK